ncbi:MAG: hypothetical protein AB1776_08425 [Bacillota bacterium]
MRAKIAVGVYFALIAAVLAYTYLRACVFGVAVVYPSLAEWPEGARVVYRYKPDPAATRPGDLIVFREDVLRPDAWEEHREMGERGLLGAVKEVRDDGCLIYTRAVPDEQKLAYKMGERRVFVPWERLSGPGIWIWVPGKGAGKLKEVIP